MLNMISAADIFITYFYRDSHNAVGTFEEMERLLENFAGSALSLVIYNICKFKTF